MNINTIEEVLRKTDISGKSKSLRVSQPKIRVTCKNVQEVARRSDEVQEGAIATLWNRVIISI